MTNEHLPGSEPEDDGIASNGRSALEAALAYLHAGLSIVPIRTDGSKAPLVEWSALMASAPTESDVRRWFMSACGVGIVCGAVSELEVLDFDAPGVFDAWRELVESVEPDALKSVAVIETPKGFGRHVYLRRATPERNQRLALRLESAASETSNAKPKQTVLIETRGEGGYVLAPGCPPECHPSGRTYRHIGGPSIEELRVGPLLSDDLYVLMIRAARALDEVVHESEPERVDGGSHAADAVNFTAAAAVPGGGLLPGSDFNARVTWSELLTAWGWAAVRAHGKSVHWRRPGKDGRGCSATTGYCSSPTSGELLYVFSSNAAPFEPGRAYSKFGAFALVMHNGDFAAAASALVKAGYGSRAPGPPTQTAATSASPNAKSGARRPAVSPFIPFPLHTLPTVLRAFVERACTSIGCDPCYIALPMLGVAAAAIGNTRRIRVKPGWIEPSTVWIAIIGPSGQQKTPALNAVTRPLASMQEAAFHLHRLAQEEFEREFQTYEKNLTIWKRKKDSGEPPQRPSPPILDRFTCSDVTIESLMVLMQDQPRGLLLLRDELDGLLRSFDQYKQSKGGDVAHWLSIHSGVAAMVDRKTGPPKHIFVPKPSLSIVGGIQPQVLRKTLSTEHFHNGLAARLLLASPPRRARVWNEDGITPELEQAYTQVIQRLREVEQRFDENGVPTPEIVSLGTEAKRLWIAFYNEHADEQVHLDEDLAAAWSKLEAYCARLALILHCLREATGEAVNPLVLDESTMRAAIELTRWCAHETRRVYAVFGEDEQDAFQRRFIEIIRATGGFTTVRKWHRRRSIAKADAARAELQSLVDAGAARWERSPTRSTGGPQEERLVLIEPECGDESPTGDTQSGHLSVSDLSEVFHSATESGVMVDPGDPEVSGGTDASTRAAPMDLGSESDPSTATDDRAPRTPPSDPRGISSSAEHVEALDVGQNAPDGSDTDKCPSDGQRAGDASGRCARCGHPMGPSSDGQAWLLCSSCSSATSPETWEEYL